MFKEICAQCKGMAGKCLCVFVAITALSNDIKPPKANALQALTNHFSFIQTGTSSSSSTTTDFGIHNEVTGERIKVVWDYSQRSGKSDT